MGIPVVTNISKVFSGVDGVTFTTPSITLPGGQRIMLATMGNKSTGASAVPTIGGTAVVTWQQLATDTFNTIATPVSRITLFTTFVPTDVTGTITVTFAAAQDAGWIVVDGVTFAPVIKQSTPNSVKADAATSATTGGFTAAGPLSIMYGPTFIGVSEAVNPNAGETETAEQQGGITLEAGTLQAEYRINVGAIATNFAVANAAIMAVELGGSEDSDPFMGIVGGSLLDSRRGAY